METVVATATIGDNAGYEVARHLGPPLVASRMVRRRRERLDQAREFPPAGEVQRCSRAGRFVASFRAVMPALAGTAGMRYRRSLAVNTAGGIVWDTGVVLLGYPAGTSHAAVERTAGRGVALAVTGVVIVALWCGGSGPIGLSAAAVGRS